MLTRRLSKRFTNITSNVFTNNNLKYTLILNRNYSIMSRKRKSEDGPSNDSKKPAKSNGHWAMSLLKSMEDPKLVVKSDDLVVIIKDAYPKAEFHYLILPKEELSSLKVVTEKHKELLKHMHQVAVDLTNEEKHKNSKFLIGYHAEPSMIRLHLHVISDDMNSPCLKNKKHWNSYTTDFFLKSNDVLKSLEENGKISLLSREECKKLMETPLKCHKCNFTPKNLPDLKKHILTHIDK